LGLLSPIASLKTNGCDCPVLNYCICSVAVNLPKAKVVGTLHMAMAYHDKHNNLLLDMLMNSTSVAEGLFPLAPVMSTCYKVSDTVQHCGQLSDMVLDQQ